VAVHAVVVVGVNVQVKSAAAPAARLATLAGVQAVQPVPVTFTFEMAELPVLVSVTVIVTAVPAITLEAGLTVLVVSVVEAVNTSTVPPVVSPVRETSLPTTSLP